MNKRMWTTRSLLHLVLNSKLRDSWQADSSEELQIEHAKIVALLKAFDLYVEYKTNTTSTFCISSFLDGNFIKGKTHEEVSRVWKKIIALQRKYTPMIEEQCQYDDCEFFALAQIFENVLAYRRGLEKSMNHYRFFIKNNLRASIPARLIRNLSVEELQMQIQKLDNILLLIMGHKEPVSEEELINKYGFPDEDTLTKPQLLSGNKTIEDILAAL